MSDHHDDESGRRIIGAMRAGAAATVTVESLPSTGAEPAAISRPSLPHLVVPHKVQTPARRGRVLVLVAVEGADRKMSTQIAGLFDPIKTDVALIHVTWVGQARTSLPESGLQDPEDIDLLLYHGARTALISTAAQLREAGFSVSACLREDRRPAVAIRTEIERLIPDVVTLGLGRHGAGIGRELLREARLPILYVDAR